MRGLPRPLPGSTALAYLVGHGVTLGDDGLGLLGCDRSAVHIADDPLTCVVRGTGMVLEQLVTYERSLVTETYAIMPR